MDIGSISIPQNQTCVPQNPRQLELERLREEQREEAQELQRRERLQEELSDCTRPWDSPAERRAVRSWSRDSRRTMAAEAHSGPD